MKPASGAAHHDVSGAEIVAYDPRSHSAALVREYAEALPAGVASDLFLRAVEEVGDKLTDFDLHLLYEMADHFWNAEQARADVRENGLKVSTEWGDRPNPMLKVSRDESAAAMRIAERYALTFADRLRAGIMQLAGQTMLAQLHTEMADAIVGRILEAEVRAPLPAGWKQLRKPELEQLAERRQLTLPERATRKDLIAALELS